MLMDSINMWNETLTSVGINTYLAFEETLDINEQTPENASGVGINIGINDIRVIFFDNLYGKSYDYRERLIYRTLELLCLSRNYPWVIVSLNSITIIIRSSDSKDFRMFNMPPLLWSNTKRLIINKGTYVRFFNNEYPHRQPMIIDALILSRCINTLIEEWYMFKEDNFFPIVEDVDADRCITSWSLFEFLKLHGPKIQLGGFVRFRNLQGEHWPVCRIGNDGKYWIYAYISLRFRNVSVGEILRKAEFLRIGKLPNGHYVLYDNSPKIWEDVPIQLPMFDKVPSKAENDFNIIRQNDKYGIQRNDSVVILEPLFYSIDSCSSSGKIFRVQNEDTVYYVYPYTYGEGLVRADDSSTTFWGYDLQCFIDNKGNKVLVFDEAWVNSRNVEVWGHIKPDSTACFENGVLRIIISHSGIVETYEIDKEGYIHLEEAEYDWDNILYSDI